MGLTRIRADQIADIDYKQAVRVITLSNVTLSLGAPAQVDGVTLNQGDRVLVAGQSTATQNGLYRVDAAGTGSNGTWVRANDANTTGEIQAGMIVMITEGTVWADTSWKLITNDPIAIGGTALIFTQNTGDSFSTMIANGVSIQANAVSSAVTYTPGNNFVITGNATTDTVTFSVADAPVFTGNVQADYFIGNGSQLTGITSTYGNATVTTYGETGWAGNIIPLANVTYTLGNATNQWASVYIGANTLYINNVAVSVNSSNVLTVAGANVTTQNANGNVTAGNVSTTGNITGTTLNIGNINNNNANGVGNIGSSSAYFDTVFAKATSAQYADLAEMYCADANYAPGTVVEFGGAEEITQTTATHSTCVAGIVSTNPSYLMNATLACENAIGVALVGRVPCRVVGTIAKGDRMVSSNLPGVATAMKSADYQPGCIIGKALEDYNSEEVGTIEVVAGRV